jgi:hypothetical protein
MLLLALALTAGLAGCGSSDAPLRAAPSGESQGFCKIKQGQGITYGLEDFTNHSSQTVGFDRVGIRDPRNLKVLGARLTPGDRYLVGMWPTWPPHPQRSYPLASSWKHRRLVAGYRLRPGKSAGVVLGIEPTAFPASTAGMLIWYHTASGSYVLRDDLKIYFVSNCREVQRG